MNPRRWFVWHSWLGVTGGLLLFVICWSGTVAVLSYEIDWLLNPALRVEPRDARVSLDAIVEAVRTAYPDRQISSIAMPLYPRFASDVIAETPGGRPMHVYVDPHTGEIQGHTSYFNVQRFFRSFHMMLFGLEGWGFYIVGFFSLVLLASMLTSLMFYQHWWRRFLALRIGRGARAFWSDLHKLSGLWSLWFVLVIGVTGVWYLAEDIAGEWLYAKLQYSEEPKCPASAEPHLPFATLAARAEARWPDLDVSNIVPAGSYYGGAVYFEGQADAWLVRERSNKLFLDPATGRELQRQQATELPLGARWIDTADPLHFGNFGGLLSKLIWFGSGLILSSLALTGAYLHVKRRQLVETSRIAVTQRARLAAIAVSTLVLLLSIKGGWHEIRDYGVKLQGGNDAWPLVEPMVIVFISAWALVTVATIAIWSWKLAAPAVKPMAHEHKQRLSEDSRMI